MKKNIISSCFFFIFLIACLLFTGKLVLADETWTCPECGNIVSGNFCNICGAQKPAAEWVCPNCGETVTGNFCNICGTARDSSGTSSSSPSSSASQVPIKDAANIEEETEEIASEAGEIPTSINWKEFTVKREDLDGYTFDITYKLSPWILLKENEELVQSVWSGISNGNTLPGINDWGLKNGNGVFYKNFNTGLFYSSLSDAYYCMGTVEITNTTNGWDFTPDNPYHVNCGLHFHIEKKEGSTADVFSISRMFYSNEVDEYENIIINAEMTSNHWGPIPFVIMSPEEFTPKYPNGENIERMLRSVLSWTELGNKGADSVQLCIIDKNGDIQEPVLDEDELKNIYKYNFKLID